MATHEVTGLNFGQVRLFGFAEGLITRANFARATWVQHTTT
ncbi:MAG: hypothetical protein RL388_433, partial [Actinomycetota bacterium]